MHSCIKDIAVLVYSIARHTGRRSGGRSARASPRTHDDLLSPGLRSEARDLAAEFESEPRILPAFSTLAPGRLTVLLVG